MKTARQFRARVAGARLLLAVVAIYLAVAAFPSHRSFAALLGGICLAYVIAFLGALIERNRAAARAAEAPEGLTAEELVELVEMADEAFKDYCEDRNDDFDIAYGRAVERATLARKAEK